MRQSLLYALVVSLFASLSISAQSTLGHLQGVVRDPGGAPLPGAIVTARATAALSPTRTATTGADGVFTIRDLAVGRYRISASHPGFAVSATDVAITANATRAVTLLLTAAPARDAVTAVDAPKTSALPERQYQKRGTGNWTGGIVGGLAGAPPPPMEQAPYAHGAFYTEAYDKIDDSRWTPVSNRPLSTFSTDVDTASYANVRRFLGQGQMPPKDAVRIEELINYFSYEYPEPSGDAPFSITTSLAECPWNAGHRLALIGLQARHLDSSTTPPRNLVFLIDVSGSMMAPNKLPLVKASLAMLARNLTEHDRIALVVYAGAAGIVLPPTSGADTSTVLEGLRRLQAGGATNGAQGLQLAYNVARQQFIKGGSNRVVLATDGDFNVGVTSQGDLLRLIEEQRASGVTLSVLGFGMGNLKDSMMEKLADRGNGNYSYIDSLGEAQKVLVEEAGGTLVTVAKDVKLQVEFNPRVVSAYRLIGYENRRLEERDFNDDTKDAGDMGAGHSVTALYELELAGATAPTSGVDPLKYQQRAPLSAAANRGEAMAVKVRYKKPDGDDSALLSVPVALRLSSSPALGFAAAVAEFGLLLRDSEFKGSASYAHAAAMAARYQGADRHGHRAEFLRLIGAAEALDAMNSSSSTRER